MAHRELRREALRLRSLGKSYGQIKKELNVSKSTLSEWLRKHPLTEEQLNQLRSDNEEFRIEKYRAAMLHKRGKKLNNYYKQAKDLYLPMSKRELMIGGLLLYWGEGGKTSRGQVSISNTDPAVIRFSLMWMQQSLKIPLEKVKAYLHLYKDMDIDKETDFWSQELNLPKVQFTKPYIKKSARVDIDQKGFGHGTCNLRVSDTVVKENILMAIKAIADYSTTQIQNL